MLVAKVKICGITNYEDAVMAMDWGTDLLGFNFFPESPRYIPLDKAAAIVRRLPGHVELVGVFVNAPLEALHQAISECQLDWVQLHGDEPPAFCQSLASDTAKVIKAFRVKDRFDPETAEPYRVDAILLDAFHPSRYGGTGKSFDWDVIHDNVSMRIFLAGGITPDNAAKAISLGVYGIDVCSGVESEPGKKDPEKLKALFENIRYLRG
jgi:phosphoribosylanthranilate isomerase